MTRRTLGNTTTSIPVIGQGATHVGSYARHDELLGEKRIKVWRAGIDVGMNLIDTADLYGGGLSEELVGKALKGIRQKVILATKFNPRPENCRESIKRSLENSLRRLQTDYVDLFQLHFPNPAVRIEEVGEAVWELMKAGEILHFGVSNFSVEELEAAQQSLRLPVVSNQVEYNLADRSAENGMLSLCERTRVTLFAYSPLGAGRLRLDESAASEMKRIADKYDKSVYQISLGWLIAKPQVAALVKSAKLEHLLDNAEAAAFPISEEDLACIDKLQEPTRIMVPTEKILLEGDSGRHVYATKEEALKNASDLIPSPELLAARLRKTGDAKPIHLVRFADPTGRFRYKLDPYDLLGQAKRYWAWVMAYGEDREIPAYVGR
jgi:aryl-alcohol dehydrogenase-like predicted oxidoreductase